MDISPQFRPTAAMGVDQSSPLCVDMKIEWIDIILIFISPAQLAHQSSKIS
jgi:hypothetical protein